MLWFAAGKNSALKIEGFATDYTGLKLEYEITANGAGNQNIIKVLTDKGDVDVPICLLLSKISTNLLHWQYLMGLLIFSLPVKNQLIPLVIVLIMLV